MPVARPATRLRQTLCRTTSPSTTTKNVSSLPPRLEPLPRASQPTVSSEDGHHTLRLRQNGNKSLPLPQLLDPKVIAAKKKYTAAKAEIKQHEQTEFQKELAANPYARALAMPIRQCHVTRARLPLHFLQPFSASISNTPTPEGIVSGKKRPTRPVTVSLVPHARREMPRGSQLLTSTYALNTHSTMQHLSKKRAWARLADQRMQEQYARLVDKKGGKGIDIGREWLWDDDMPEVVLGQLREDVMNRMNGLVEDQNRFTLLVPLSEVTEERRDEVKGLLHLAGQADAGKDDVGKHIPAFALSDLLDESACQEFCQKFDLEASCDSSILALLSSRHTLQLLLALDRLAMYLGQGSNFKYEQDQKERSY